MKIYFLRHGQTVMNDAHVLQGQSNSDLNETGIEQAKKAGEEIRKAGITFDRIYCSPLHRTVQTCRYATGLEEDRFQLDDRLMEIALGDLEGVPFQSLDARLRDDFMRHPFRYEAPEGGERIQDVVDRVQSFLDELKKTENDDTVLIVSHGGTLHAFLYCMVEKPQDLFWLPWIGNCDLIRAELKDGRFTVEEKYQKYEIPEGLTPI